MLLLGSWRLPLSARSAFGPGDDPCGGVRYPCGEELDVPVVTRSTPSVATDTAVNTDHHGSGSASFCSITIKSILTLSSYFTSTWWDGPVDRLQRFPEQGVTDRAALDALLDSQWVGVLSCVVDGLPLAVPMLYARDGDRLLLHGSTGAGALRQVAAGARRC